MDFYTEVKDLDYLVPLLEADVRTKRFSSLNRIVCDIVEDFGLVSFETLAVEVSTDFLRLPWSLGVCCSHGPDERVWGCRGWC